MCERLYRGKRCWHAPWSACWITEQCTKASPSIPFWYLNWGGLVLQRRLKLTIQQPLHAVTGHLYQGVKVCRICNSLSSFLFFFTKYSHQFWFVQMSAPWIPSWRHLEESVRCYTHLNDYCVLPLYDSRLLLFTFLNVAIHNTYK